MKDQRFDMMLTADDKDALKRLAEAERLPAAAVVRRLIWAAAQQQVKTGYPPVQRPADSR